MKIRKITPKRMSDMAIPMKSEKEIYPKLCLSYKDLPEAKDWKNGETYTLEITVKQIGSRDDEYGSEATFEIHKVGVDEKEN